MALGAGETPTGQKNRDSALLWLEADDLSYGLESLLGALRNLRECSNWAFDPKKSAHQPRVVFDPACWNHHPLRSLQQLIEKKNECGRDHNVAANQHTVAREVARAPWSRIQMAETTVGKQCERDEPDNRAASEPVANRAPPRRDRAQRVRRDFIDCLLLRRAGYRIRIDKRVSHLEFQAYCSCRSRYSIDATETSNIAASRSEPGPMALKAERTIHSGIKRSAANPLASTSK